MKKLFTLLLVFAATLATHAQFSKDTKYVSTSLSGLNLEYNRKGSFRMGLNTDVGYFVADALMLRGSASFKHYGKNADQVTLGAGVRYYFLQNGISLGTGLEYSHLSPNINDLRIPLEVGYTFYLNHYIAIEPAVYYKMSINDFADGSEVGFRIGLGYYF
ncbi:hypothetical protein EII14_07015 [Alloprevotella sp. OH1205_COT-284]|uniref:hypothetical protein n=1 Tax=Alloprevotella sp. OH1205_COT-284 TaxID=2491043 RepID=UPI000F5EB457|nr:hypothetical protein [Alloprevotella sp. OH1205_COT-284]RRD78236.1 hypothetical protein EII14_07015 [Alloprevotella sp. OH1205_COT-284]